MSIQRKFILIFVGFNLLVALILSAVSIGFLKETYDRIIHAANISYLPVMASHMFIKATMTFGTISLFIVIISIPCGILLSRRLSAPYLRIFENLSTIAHERLEITTKTDLADSEKKLLEKYMGLLAEDVKSLKEYEKVKSWKDGARMLMHELKNPLTPLKLSAQSLTLIGDNSDAVNEDATRIVSSVKDIETILSYFKELVNIEFGPLVVFDMKKHVHAFCGQVKQSLGFRCAMPPDVRAFFVLSEPTLVTMLLTNLVKNGLAENKPGFYVEVSEAADTMAIRCVTPDARIDDASKIFKLGYSTKGEKRGFGLFLCKKISDYLDLNIQFQQENDNVVFSLYFKKCRTT
jgi:two-component system, NtrC family, nitrogen regulation sensor histidine kinase NtrY